MDLLLLGDEAVAQGALDAGISGCYAYPGTPSTEIMEYVQRAPETAQRGVHAQWSSNEKTAIEEALGMSYAGRRALVCMKHVGLNVAADGFVNAAITGVHGGLVVAVADDPSMHSSQNEQDSRFYAEFAHVPCLEPSNQQEAYEAVRRGFDLSEKWRVPVLLRLTTRLAHSRANIRRTAPPREPNPVRLPPDPRRFVLLPMIARRNFAELLDKQAEFQAAADGPDSLNEYMDAGDCSLGIIACGIGVNYVMETFHGECPHPLVKVSQYPPPRGMIQRLVDSCERLLVVEEGWPFVETRLTGLLRAEVRQRIDGRTTGALPREGELTPEAVARALGRPLPDAPSLPPLLKPRPPQLCRGCPHADSFRALLEALGDVGPGHVFSDIGCYTLGALPPWNAINSCVDMGASISMAKGAADAGFLPAVAVIGDSTFTHSGMTPLLDAVWEQTPITVIILDNATTAMTGGQDSPATGRLEQIVTGLGVNPEHVHVLPALPNHHGGNVRVLKQEIFEVREPSVIIMRRECVQTARRRARKQSSQRAASPHSPA